VSEPSRKKNETPGRRRDLPITPSGDASLALAALQLLSNVSDYAPIKHLEKKVKWERGRGVSVSGL